jgi:hypothetical protein
LLLSIDLARSDGGGEGGDDLQARVDDLAQRHASTHADTEGTWALQTGGLAYQRGELGQMTNVLVTMTVGPHARTWTAALALARSWDGDLSGAAALLAGNDDVPVDYFWMTVRQAQAEAAVAVGDLDRCQRYFDELAPFEGRVGLTSSGSLCFGLVGRSLGELALALGRVELAVATLDRAMRQADTIGWPTESVITRRVLAAALVAAGRAEEAEPVREAALEIARRRGFAREVRLLEAAADAAR